MSSSETPSSDALYEEPADGTALEATTRIVKRLMARQAVLVEAPHSTDDSTDTVGVMLRLGPDPTAILMMRDEAARARIAAMLAGMGLAFTQSTPSIDALNKSALGSTMLLTDDLDLVRRMRANRTIPHIHCLYLYSGSTSNLADAILAGADDGIYIDAGDDGLRTRLIVTSRHAHLEASFRALLRENRVLSTIDALTKVANRRFFARHFRLEVDRAERYQRPMSLVMCDIDHFKKVNDTYGHVAGDAVLKEFGSRLQQAVRQGTDWVARLGGEEFAIVLPETGVANAARVTHKLRERIRAKPFATNAGLITVTASFGVCELFAVSARESNGAERLLEAADSALYRSKRNGRDRATVWSLDESSSAHATIKPTST